MSTIKKTKRRREIREEKKRDKMKITED